jgi:hypothetical protein
MTILDRHDNTHPGSPKVANLPQRVARLNFAVRRIQQCQQLLTCASGSISKI